MNKLTDILQKDSFMQRAVIREDECIGCTKCIQACPFDAIIGASKLMHTVIPDVCTGCGLCVPPCPVDCIDMISVPEKSQINQAILYQKSSIRFDNRNIRLAREKQSEEAVLETETLDARKTEIKAALERAKKKRARM